MHTLPQDRSFEPSERPAHFETVCHRLFTSDPTYYPQIVYGGRMKYFCTEACLHAFLDGPERFIIVHVQEMK